jgi:hypothetical protein
VHHTARRKSSMRNHSIVFACYPIRSGVSEQNGLP